MCGKVTEEILDIFFENFSQVEGIELRAKYKRREMVNYFSALIQGCRRGEEYNPQRTCQDAIVAILRHHRKSIESNGGICMMGKYHDVLYVAVKLCYHWQLKDNPTVVAVLDQIYLCEKTFENIWLGALTGIREPYFDSAWNNDYEDLEDNFRAVFYLLNHATNARLEYPNENGEIIKYIDVLFKSYNFPPLKVVLIFGLPDKVHTLLRFGAAHNNNMLHIIFNCLVNNHGSYPYNLVACFRFLLRASSHKDMIELQKKNSESFNKVIEDCHIPLEMCGIEPSNLKHLCRCCIRNRLRQNYQLPNGIKILEIPVVLHRYLNLLMD